MKKELNEKIRIAHVVGKWVGGGVEAVIMNYYKNINHNNFQFDFLCDEDSTNIPYDEIEKLGGRVILIPPYQKVFKYHKELKKIFRDNNYKIVHSHINTLSVFPLFAAKRVGVKVRIAHSHSTTNKKEWRKNLLKIILRPFAKIFATNYMACTEHAGRWLFGDREYDKGNVYLLNNAIDLDKFKYSERIRKNKRKELGISDDTFVIGHIGRFVEQKNHRFLIDIFYEFHKNHQNSLLLLIGQGPLEEEMRHKVDDLGLTSFVKFIGQRNDVNELYSAMDLFLFPSLYEGLGMVLIEAQCSGLPCIASSEVPEIAKINDNFCFIDLEKDATYWQKKVNDFTDIKLRENNNHLNYNNYDIKKEVNKLSFFYLDFVIINKVELFGLPASGKSTYYKNNLSFMNNLNCKIHLKSRIVRNIKKISYSFLLFIFYRNIYKKCFEVLKKFHFKNKKTNLKMYFYINSIAYLAVKNKKNSYLLEEGLLQVLWALCYNSSYTESDIEFYLETLNDLLPNKVICIYFDDETILNRLLTRNSNGGSELEHEVKDDSNKIFYARKIEKDIISKLDKNISIEVVNQ